MVLQSSGQISLIQVRAELGLTGQVSLEEVQVRSLIGIASGQLSLEEAYSKCACNCNYCTCNCNYSSIQAPSGLSCSAQLTDELKKLHTVGCTFVTYSFNNPSGVSCSWLMSCGSTGQSVGGTTSATTFGSNSVVPGDDYRYGNWVLSVTNSAGSTSIGTSES